MLMKFSDQLKSITDKDNYAPLIYIHNRRIHMIYEDEEEGIRSIFTKHDEILAVLQILFNEGKDIFFLYESDEDVIDKNEILKKLDEALDKKDEKMFQEYSEKLKYYEKGE